MDFYGQIQHRDVAWPRGPAGRVLVGIGDIHGCCVQLAALIGEIERRLGPVALRKTTFVFLGDYGDRGLETPNVIDFLIALKARRRCVFLRGNHDQTLLDFVNEPSVGAAWMTFGGRETLGAYRAGLVKMTGSRADWKALQKRFVARLPRAHLEFFENTTFSFVAGDFMFVHAGVDPATPLDKQRLNDLLWIRRPFLDCRQRLEKFIIHGHSTSERSEKRDYRLGVDTGVYATGTLSAVVISGGKMIVVSVST